MKIKTISCEEESKFDEKINEFLSTHDAISVTTHATWSDGPWYCAIIQYREKSK